MGGREVGGLANMLAAHMNIEDPQHRQIVQEFWQAPTICNKHGVKAVELFEKVEAGDIKAIWIMATNPLVSMPNRNQIERALQKCDTVIVSDCVAQNDTLALANIKLPTTTWGEKDGTVTNSERRISRQKRIIDAPEHAKNDWQIICDIAGEMGFSDHFDYASTAQIFAEHAALSGYKNNTDGHAIRDFDISAYANISQREYDNIKPTQWPINDTYPNGCQHIFKDGQFFTPTRKAQFITVEPLEPKQHVSPEYPLVLNSGRYRDHWHTMTRTGKAQSLAKHIKEPFLSINPIDAKSYNINKGDLVDVTSAFGSVQIPIKLDEGVQPGTLFAPIHWNKTSASNANISNCFGSFVDPLSGQPESKFSVVNIRKVPVQQHLHIFSQTELLPKTQYWSKVKLASGYEYTCQVATAIADPLDWCKSNTSIKGQWSGFYESDSGQVCIACLDKGQLLFVAFFASDKPDINAEWIDSLFISDLVSPSQLTRLLSQQCDPAFANGKTICACFRVGEKQIIEVISTQQANTIEKLGGILKCGTNCGSCKGELAALINEHQVPSNLSSSGLSIPVNQLT